jgi:hypothetical protein
LAQAARQLVQPELVETHHVLTPTTRLRAVVAPKAPSLAKTARQVVAGRMAALAALEHQQ